MLKIAGMSDRTLGQGLFSRSALVKKQSSGVGILPHARVLLPAGEKACLQAPRFLHSAA
jgi:hypothetical protein